MKTTTPKSKRPTPADLRRLGELTGRTLTPAEEREHEALLSRFIDWGEFRDMGGVVYRDADGRKYAPSTERRARRVLHVRDWQKRAIELAKSVLQEKNEVLTAGHGALSEALASWVLRTMKEMAITLDEDEARVFAAMIARTGTTKDGAPKYMTQRKIAAALGVSAMAVNRREDKLRRDHPRLAAKLAEIGITRKPHGTRKPTVTKRKKFA